MANRLDTGGALSDAHTAELLAHEKQLYRRLLASLQRAVG
jgi:hypothetical protein